MEVVLEIAGNRRRILGPVGGAAERQRVHGRALDDLTATPRSASRGRGSPRSLGPVPVEQAAQVRAARARRASATRSARKCYATFAFSFANVGAPARGRSAVRVEQLGPRMLAARDLRGQQLGRGRAHGEPPLPEAGRHPQVRGERVVAAHVRHAVDRHLVLRRPAQLRLEAEALARPGARAARSARPRPPGRSCGSRRPRAASRRGRGSSARATRSTGTCPRAARRRGPRPRTSAPGWQRAK